MLFRCYRKVAARQGFEPRLRVPKTPVLPLHHQASPRAIMKSANPKSSDMDVRYLIHGKN